MKCLTSDYIRPHQGARTRDRTGARGTKHRRWVPGRAAGAQRAPRGGTCKSVWGIPPTALHACAAGPHRVAARRGRLERLVGEAGGSGWRRAGQRVGAPGEATPGNSVEALGHESPPACLQAPLPRGAGDRGHTERTPRCKAVHRSRLGAGPSRMDSLGLGRVARLARDVGTCNDSTRVGESLR